MAWKAHLGYHLPMGRCLPAQSQMGLLLVLRLLGHLLPCQVGLLLGHLLDHLVDHLVGRPVDRPVRHHSTPHRLDRLPVGRRPREAHPCRVGPLVHHLAHQVDHLHWAGRHHRVAVLQESGLSDLPTWGTRRCGHQISTGVGRRTRTFGITMGREDLQCVHQVKGLAIRATRADIPRTCTGTRGIVTTSIGHPAQRATMVAHRRTIRPALTATTTDRQGRLEALLALVAPQRGAEVAVAAATAHTARIRTQAAVSVQVAARWHRPRIFCRRNSEVEAVDDDGGDQIHRLLAIAALCLCRCNGRFAQCRGSRSELFCFAPILFTRLA